MTLTHTCTCRKLQNMVSTECAFDLLINIHEQVELSFLLEFILLMYCIFVVIMSLGQKILNIFKWNEGIWT